jgi:GNAT superfamily N-acetyltransferase
VPIAFAWRGDFENRDLDALHAAAFGLSARQAERDWRGQVTKHSLGWVAATSSDRLVGFVNVPWDGGAHAWLQDTMVSADFRHDGVGTQLVAVAREKAREAGCQWLHVDFDDALHPFYVDRCGFVPSSAGLIALTEAGDG